MWSSRSIVAWIWTLVVFGFCWTPRLILPVNEAAPDPTLFTYLDKLVHFLLFVGFSFSWSYANVAKIRWVLIAGVAVAVISELGQATSLINRDADWFDGLADVLGAFAGIGVYHFGRALFPPTRPAATAVTVPSSETP